ncbi:MAG: hypothetical protein NC081_02165 [Roseburia sp.]|nr:hypothetical protein [Roseburia sp.]
MEFTSILDLKPSSHREMPRSAFYTDLNLNQVIERIAMDWKEKVSQFYYYFPENRECEDYRREVYADIRREEVYALLVRFVSNMGKRQEAAAQKEEVDSHLQKLAWHIRETGFYCDALEELYAALRPVSLTSRGMQSLREYLRNYLESEAYLNMQRSMSRLRQELLGFRVTLTYDKERLIVAESQAPGAYDTFLCDCFSEPPKPLKSPFMASADLTALEEEILHIFCKKHAAFFKEAKAFYKTYAHYAQDKLLQFRSEVQFYLSFYHFQCNMQSNGFTFTAPSVSDEKEMCASGLYDLALACVNLSEGKEVVSNDMVYHKGERFFVLTGPNQGGKTTFARSLGQLVYFTKMGLDVPALSANVPYFGGILTHFSVEESIETGRGKLKEELMRLKPMMNEKHTHAFIVINELFTTAANYDACIMGKKVLEHFIAQNGQGIYVTHLRELSQGHPQVVSLKAMLDERMMQNFKIIRSEAEPAAYAVRQVEKYQLTYEQMKERLRKKQNGDFV